jgi:TRAP-type C4-dicarboxylate transport system permease small subunit
MEYFTRLVKQINGVGVALGAAFLVGMMVLIVANIIYRLAGHVVTGSYELSELMIVVTVAFALGYAALQKSHVVVKILISRFPERWQAILEAFTSFLSMGTWAVIAWASSLIFFERWLTEESEMLLIPFLPFRIVLLFGLILIALVYLIYMVMALRKALLK